MSILKKFSFILFLLMLENIDAEAQFSYTHSDGSVIACKKAPIVSTEYKGELYKKYAEIKDNKIMYYNTSAKISSPQELTRVDVEVIPLANIAFDEQHFAITVEDTDEQHPMTVMLVYVSPQMSHTYIQENGVKSKEEPTPTTNATIEFSTHESAIAFVEEVISKLPVEKQAGAKTVFENTYYGMVGETKRQQRMKMQKEQDRLKVKTDGNLIEISGKTFYMDASAVYDSNLGKIASRNSLGIEFNDTKTFYRIDGKQVLKNKQLLYYVGVDLVCYDQACSSVFLKANRDKNAMINPQYDVVKEGKEIGYYRTSTMATKLAEIAILIHYFNL